ncbi:MAG: alpha/beta fold hydrolase [Promethearchaeota archaeon]
MGNEVLTYKSVSANGLEIHYIEKGSGIPLILLHGGSLNAEINWKVNLQILAKHYHCIAVDSRGHGRTINPSREYSYSLMADDIAGLIQALKLEKPLVCGWSDGGQIAIEMGIRYSHLIRGLIAGGTLMNNTMPMEYWISQGINGPGDIDFDKFKEKSPDFHKLLEEAHKPQGPEYWKILLQDLTKMWFDDSSYPGDNIRKITAPSLIIQADGDEIIPMSEAINLYQSIPNSELAVIPGATHALSIMGVRSSVFTYIIIDFIERLIDRKES